jgi:hypothetical protein
VSGKQASPVDSVRAIFDALEPLDEVARARAIASAMSLLGMEVQALGMAPSQKAVVSGQASETDTALPITPRLDRALSLVEVIEEKKPATNPQRIAVFAFYRERVQGQPRFSRHDLESYFADARVSPPANYDRDFNSAVKQGWIHEDDDQSYLTTKGIEAVEAGFGGKRSRKKATQSRKTTSKGRKTKKRGTQRKSPVKKVTAKRKSVRRGSSASRRKP